MKLQKNTFLKFLAFFLIGIIIIYLPTILFYVMLDLKLLSLMTENIISICELLFYVLGYVILFMLYKKNKFSLKYISVNSTKMKLIHFLLVAIIFFSYFVVETTFLPSTNEVIQRSKCEVIVAWLSIIIVAPIFEEIFFRGILLQQLFTRYNHLTSILIGSLLFGLLHYQANQPEKIISAIFFSIIICEVFYITRNIYLAIWAHLIFNSSIWIIVLLDKINILELKINDEVNNLNFPLFIIISAIIILIITFIGWLSNMYKINNEEKKVI